MHAYYVRARSRFCYDTHLKRKNEKEGMNENESDEEGKNERMKEVMKNEIKEKTEKKGHIK